MAKFRPIRLTNTDQQATDNSCSTR